MAERRMVSKSFINSAKFMKMGDSAKLLYFYLNINADDDGIVEVFPFFKMLNTPEDDVINLAEKEFIIFLNDDWLSFLPHWLQNNQLRSDRYKPSIYRNMLLNLFPKHKNNLKSLKQEQLKNFIQTESLLPETITELGWYANGLPKVTNSETQYSIEKSSLEKDRIDKTSQVNHSLEANKFYEVDENLKSRLFKMITSDKEDILIVVSQVFNKLSVKDNTTLAKMIKKYDSDLIIEVLAISYERNVKKINYILTILQDFERRGIQNYSKLIANEKKMKNKLLKKESIPAWLKAPLEKTEREKKIYKKYMAEKASSGVGEFLKLYTSDQFNLVELVILKRWLVKEKKYEE